MHSQSAPALVCVYVRVVVCARSQSAPAVVRVCVCVGVCVVLCCVKCFKNGWLLFYKAFLHCQAGLVEAWHARQFHRLISSFLCKTEGVKSPVSHSAGFLGSLEKASLELFRIICLFPNVFILL